MKGKIRILEQSSLGMAIFEQKRRKKDQKMIARNNNLFIYIYIKYDNNFLSLFQREKKPVQMS